MEGEKAFRTTFPPHPKMTTPNATGIAMGASVAPINSSFLPNPFTPMAFLPPDVARQVVVSVYVLVGTTSVCLFLCQPTTSSTHYHRP